MLPGTNAERLQQFYRQPDKFGPMLVNTTVDSEGYTGTVEMLQSPWNQALIHNWAVLCQEITNVCPDRSRFGQEMQLYSWERQITDRLYRIFLAITKTLPQSKEENFDDIKTRLLEEYKRVKKMNLITNSRHTVRAQSYSFWPFHISSTVIRRQDGELTLRPL